MHVKLSGFHHWCRERYPYRDGLPFAEAAVRAFGADALHVGLATFPTSWPAAATSGAATSCLREATFLSKEELDLVMGGTAERLWFG